MTAVLDTVRQAGFAAIVYGVAAEAELPGSIEIECSRFGDGPSIAREVLAALAGGVEPQFTGGEGI
jgi:hypothetical protein